MSIMVRLLSILFAVILFSSFLTDAISADSDNKITELSADTNYIPFMNRFYGDVDPLTTSYRLWKRAPMDRSAMVRFGKRAPMDRSAMVRFGKRAPMDRSAMVRFGKRAPMDRSAMVRFGKRAPMDRSAMVRFGKRVPDQFSNSVRYDEGVQFAEAV